MAAWAALFPMTEVVAASSFTPWLQGITPAGLVAQWQAPGPDHDPTAQLPHLDGRPLLLIHSERDEVVPIAHAEALAAASPAATRLLRHPDANHAFTWHRPWLRARLLAWLDGLPLADRGRAEAGHP